jgi:hypothetical protein
MKHVTYTAGTEDFDLIKLAMRKHFKQCEANYTKNPDRYGDTPLNSLKSRWADNSELKALFEVFQKDGLASISKESDSFCSMSDLKGDLFKPDLHVIDQKELKRQERNFERRVYRNGVHFHRLVVMCKDVDAIGGFVANDFYGSGYDSEFYNQALALIEVSHPTYTKELMQKAGVIRKNLLN